MPVHHRKEQLLQNDPVKAMPVVRVWRRSLQLELPRAAHRLLLHLDSLLRFTNLQPHLFWMRAKLVNYLHAKQSDGQLPFLHTVHRIWLE